MTYMRGDHPNTWDEFVGQEMTKRQLQVAARSAKLRGEPMEHILLASGVPGIGKTSLALLAAMEAGARFKIVSGKMSANAARIALSQLRDGDVLIYDEIHQAMPQAERWLLHLLQNGVIVGPLGPEKQPKITVIGVTTDVGRLPDTIIGRFPLQPVFEPYTDQEAQLITLKLSAKIFPREIPWPCGITICEIAEAANNNPRVIRSILINLRDLLLCSDEVDEHGNYDLDEVLEWNGLTFDGLNDIACKYLTTLMKDFQGQAGEKAIADRLQQPAGVASIERLLMDKGLIGKTRSGRVLTQAGIRRARLLDAGIDPREAPEEFV